jgi:hypothetical protein
MVDRMADWLIWVDYAERITRGAPIEVLAVRVSDGISDAPGDLTRDQLTKRASNLRAVWFDPAALSPTCCDGAHTLQGRTE